MATPNTTAVQTRSAHDRSAHDRSAHDPASPLTPVSTPRRRKVIGGVVGLALAVPLSVALAGSGQAAPTLTIAQAQAQLTALHTQEDAADEAYNAGMIAATSAQTQSQAAIAAVGRQSARLNTMQAAIASFAAASYTTGGLNPIDSLLAGGDPQTLLSRAAAMNEIARTQGAQLTAMTAQREVLAGAQQTAKDKARDASAALRKLAAARSAITSVIAQEQAVLGHLQAQARQELLLEQARADAASRAQARAAIAKTLAPAPAPSAAATHSPGISRVPVRATGAGRLALQAAFSQLNKPYYYGAAGPNAYDCSGLVMWAFAHAGVSLPHSAAAQYGYGTHVSESQLLPGDIVFFDEGGGIGHDGIYVGGGQMIDANHSGGSVGVRDLYSGFIGGTRL